MADYIEFSCPNEECDWQRTCRWIPATRHDPGYFEPDPPSECESCGADMSEGDGERYDPSDPVDAMFEQADEAFERAGDR